MPPLFLITSAFANQAKNSHHPRQTKSFICTKYYCQVIRMQLAFANHVIDHSDVINYTVISQEQDIFQLRSVV